MAYCATCGFKGEVYVLPDKCPDCGAITSDEAKAAFPREDDPATDHTIPTEDNA